MKRSRINPVSAKRKRRQAAYAIARQEVYERAHGRCEARIEGVCTGLCELVHHKRRRSQGGTDELSNLVGVCDSDHRWIHDHPHFASEMGLLVLTEADA